MALNDLTGQNIQDTFQKVIQTDGTNLADGTGSALPIKFDGYDLIVSGALRANSYIVSQSILNVSSGSTAFGDTVDDSHTFIGKISVGDSSYKMNIGVIGSSPAIGWDLSVGSYALASNPSYTTLNAGDGDHIRFNIGGVNEKIRMDSSGRLGIGTTLPSEKLEVAGNIKASGTITAASSNIVTIDGGTW